MPIFTLQIYGTSSCRGVEVAPSWKRRLSPKVVVPTGPHHPSVIRNLGRPRTDPRQRFLERRRAFELDAQVPFSQRLEVDVRIDQTRPGAPARARPRTRTPGARRRAAERAPSPTARILPSTLAATSGSQPANSVGWITG